MLPSLRLIVATFLGAFVLASAGMQLAAKLRVERDNRTAEQTVPVGRLATTAALRSGLDRPPAGLLVPAIFELRDDADPITVAIIPTRLTTPSDIVGRLPVPLAIATPAAAVALLPPPGGAALLPAPAEPSPPIVPPAAAEPAPRADIGGWPDDTADLAVPLPYRTVLLPMPPAAPAVRADVPATALPATPPPRPRRLARRAAAAKPARDAAPLPLFNLFGSRTR